MERHAALRVELAYAREQTDRLFRLISPDALYSRPIAERHRLIFYLGHFDAFDWNLLARRGLGESAFHPEFDCLFERGIDPPPGEAPVDTAKDWPRREEVESYNSRTRQWLDRHLDELDPALLQMGIEHRHMHAETFAYLMHNLPYGEKKNNNGKKLTPRPAPPNPMIRIESGSVTLGKTPEGFGWDNEHLAHEVALPAFGISRYKISNGEYLDFVREGGDVPHFWERDGDRWFYRGMFELYPLPLDCPVWVTWQQADGYARWRGLALATEAQFQRAADLTAADAAPDPASDNFGFVNWDAVPVDAGAAHVNTARPELPSQLVGNGWEWTRDLFAPFDGFEPHPFYPGYSADFFDGKHYVMKGASPRTAALLTRPTFRNWFRPEYPYMYAGFRLVEN
jgi:formylglycine-generating enzyme required for sulfatase activity